MVQDKNLGNQGTHNLIVRPSLVVFIVFFTKKIRNIRTTIQKTWDKFNVMKIRIILVISFNPLWADFADQKLILIVCNLLNRFLFSETSFVAIWHWLYNPFLKFIMQQHFFMLIHCYYYSWSKKYAIFLSKSVTMIWGLS